MVSDRRIHRSYTKRQSQPTCIVCPENPPCACGAGEVCIELNRDCNNCGTQECVAQALSTPTSAPSSRGISTGALAGAVSGVAVLLILVILAAFFAVKRQRGLRRKAPLEVKEEKPVPVDVVLQRSDPYTPPPVPANETPSTSSFSAGQSSANFRGSNPSSQGATQGHTPMSSRSYPALDPNRSNPNLISATFNPSIRQTDADSMVLSSSRSQAGMPPLFPNIRATLGLQIDRTRDRSRLALPERADNVRNSVQTTSTFSSETSTSEPVMAQGAIRQVLGFTRAEVVRTPKHSMSSLHPSVHMRRLSGALSTLAFSGGPRDGSGAYALPPIPSRLGKRSPDRSELEPLRNPFSDIHAAASSSAPSPDTPESGNSLARSSPAPTSATFGETGDTGSPMRRSWGKQSSEDVSRPFSLDSHSGSVASATALHDHLISKLSTPRSLTVPPPHDLPGIPVSAALSTARSPNERAVAAPSSGVLQRQQLLAIDEAKAKSRITASSVADSLLSSFPFVPPSPHGSTGSHHSAHPPSSFSHQPLSEDGELRYSASAYTDTSQSSLLDTQHPLTPGGRQRASLDTVALSSDLARYPLSSDGQGKGKGVQRAEH